MKYRFIIILISLCTFKILGGQSLVYGGFVSFNLSDNNWNSANAGGVIFNNEYKNACLMVQSGSIFGSSKIFESKGVFKENCEFQTNSSKINVYPNPSPGIFNISCSELSNIYVYNSLGQEIFKKPNVLSQNGVYKIDLADYPQGNYYLKIYKLNGFHDVVLIVKTNE